MAFMFYLRPRETLSLKTRCLCRPAHVRGRFSSWSLVLHPQEDGLRSKTGVQDESILADSPAYPWKTALFEKIAKQPQESLMFSTPYATWLREFRRAAKVEELVQYGELALHQLRHGGASHEML
eukprot:2058091-Karenia_brevis.AAC.1